MMISEKLSVIVPILVLIYFVPNFWFYWGVLCFITFTGLIWKIIELMKSYNNSHWFDEVEENMEIYNLQPVTEKDVIDFMSYKSFPYKDRHKINKRPIDGYFIRRRIQSKNEKIPARIIEWWGRKETHLSICFEDETMKRVIKESDFEYFPNTKERLGIE